MKYFAYDGHINIDELVKLCPSATVVSSACIKRYELQFQKVDDVEANAVWTGKINDTVCGVVFDINKHDAKLLDAHKAKAYIRKRCSITVDGKRNKMWMYITKTSFQKAQPLQSYVNKIISGGELHKLPESYLSHMRAIDYKKISRLYTEDTTVHSMGMRFGQKGYAA